MPVQPLKYADLSRRKHPATKLGAVMVDILTRQYSFDHPQRRLNLMTIISICLSGAAAAGI